MSGGGRLQTWSTEELADLRRSARLTAAVFDVERLAAARKRSAVDVNQALDALLGRAPDEAKAWLNRPGGGRVERRGSFRAFLHEVFG